MRKFIKPCLRNEGDSTFTSPWSLLRIRVEKAEACYCLLEKEEFMFFLLLVICRLFQMDEREKFENWS